MNWWADTTGKTVGIPDSVSCVTSCSNQSQDVNCNGECGTGYGSYISGGRNKYS